MWDNTVNYNDSWGKHSLGVMLGQSMRQEKYHIVTATANNVPEDQEQYWYVNQGDENTRKSSEGAYRYRGLSWFGRINYNYASKYYLMLTFRADGSSKYQEHWGYFPSVGASWVISEAETLTNDIITSGKFSLYADFYELFKIKGKECDESLFEVQCTDFGQGSGDMVGSVSRPVEELRGFKRVHLAKGETKTVSFDITAETLKFYNSDLEYICEPGDFQVMVGPNGRDVQTFGFTLK